MKRLPFERAFLLDSYPCDRCQASGRFTLTRTCLYCRGLGRRITAEGRRLFYEICELLGKPVLRKESRIQPKHLETIMGSQLRVGMKVAPVRGIPPAPFQEIVEIRLMKGDRARLLFEDGSGRIAEGTESFRRELTSAELDVVQVLMSGRLGNGAAAV